MGVHPLTGKMYYVRFYEGLFKLDYVGSGNQPPTAVADREHDLYGPSPLAVQFTGTGSSVPEALPLSYLWNFNDGSPVSQSTAANPSHTFAPRPRGTDALRRDAQGDRQCRARRARPR